MEGASNLRKPMVGRLFHGRLAVGSTLSFPRGGLGLLRPRLGPPDMPPPILVSASGRIAFALRAGIRRPGDNPPYRRDCGWMVNCHNRGQTPTQIRPKKILKQQVRGLTPYCCWMVSLRKERVLVPGSKRYSRRTNPTGTPVWSAASTGLMPSPVQPSAPPRFRLILGR